MSEPMEPEPQPQDGPVAMVEELQASIAEDFDGLFRRMALIRKRQDSRLQSLLDMLKADGSSTESRHPAAASHNSTGVVDPAHSGASGGAVCERQKRRRTTKLPTTVPTLSGVGLFSADDEWRLMVDTDNDGNDERTGQMQNRIRAIKSLERRMTADSILRDVVQPMQHTGQGEEIPTRAVVAQSSAQKEDVPARRLRFASSALMRPFEDQGGSSTDDIESYELDRSDRTSAKAASDLKHVASFARWWPSSVGSESAAVTKTVTSAKKAATRAIGHTQGLLHTHIPAHGVMAGGRLGRAQRFYLEWSEAWKNEPERKGRLARFVDGSMTYMCMLVILANAAVMAAVANEEMQRPKNQVSPVFDSVEYVFIVSYLIEQVLKLTVHRLYHLLGQGATWNWFDILVLTSSIMSLAPGSQGVGLTSLRSLRVLKVAKFLRLLRIFRIFTPLRHMLTALLASAVPLLWSLIMLAFLMYMFALFFLQVCSSRLADPDVLPGSPLWVELQTNFGSVERTMYTLFASLTGGDWTEHYANIREVGTIACMGYLFYIAFFNVAVLNIVTGMFVNAAMKLGQPDLDEQASDKLRDYMNHLEELRLIANEIDSDSNGFMSATELRQFIRNPSARARLAVLGVDAKDANGFVSLLSAASDGAPISVNDFVNGCCRLSGDASSIDLQCHAFQMGLLLNSQRELVSLVLELCETVDHVVPMVGPQAFTGETPDCVVRPEHCENGGTGGRGQVHPSPCANQQHQARDVQWDGASRLTTSL